MGFIQQIQNSVSHCFILYAMQGTGCSILKRVLLKMFSIFLFYIFKQIISCEALFVIQVVLENPVSNFSYRLCNNTFPADAFPHSSFGLLCKSICDCHKSNHPKVPEIIHLKHTDYQYWEYFSHSARDKFPVHWQETDIL